MKYKNYRNPYTKDNRIYSFTDLYNMPFGEVIKNKKELLGQFRVLGVPREEELQSSENVVYVEAYTRDDGTEVKAHYRSKPNGGSVNNYDNSINDERVDNESEDKSKTPTGGASEENGDRDNQNNILNNKEPGNENITGAAARIRRENESKDIENLPKNNNDFFEKERNNPQSVLMRINADKNKDRPDAKLFMDIALIGPKNVRSTQDYQFISYKKTKEINEKYNLIGNKEIPDHYDGFEFNANSPTAKALNNSEEFKNQILDSKNYDSVNGTFKREKLEIEFNNDKNLQYSFGHMTVLNPKIENGYITGMVYDKYNYEAMYGKKFQSISKETRSLNNNARVLQATSKLKNYYVLVPVKIKL